MLLHCKTSVVLWPCPTLKCLSAIDYGCTNIPVGPEAHAVFTDISACLIMIWGLIHSLQGGLQHRLQPAHRYIFVWSWDSFIPLLMTGQTGEQLRFGPSLSNPAALTKSRFNCDFYLHKSASFFWVRSLFSPSHLQSDPGKKKKKSELFQPGPNRLHPHFIHPAE